MPVAATDEDSVPWRERAFVSVRETALILARSPGWVRDRIGEGRLTCVRVTPGGPIVVCVPSLIALVDCAIAVPASSAVRAARPYLSKLRLVVSNR